VTWAYAFYIYADRAPKMMAGLSYAATFYFPFCVNELSLLQNMSNVGMSKILLLRRIASDG
jgi:hypothetical protein